MQVSATDDDVGNNGAVQYNFSNNQQVNFIFISHLVATEVVLCQ